MERQNLGEPPMTNEKKCMADVCLHTGIPVDCGKCSKIDDR